MEMHYYQRLRLKIETMTLCFSLIPLLSLGVTVYYQFGLAYNNKMIESLRTLAQNRLRAIELPLTSGSPN